jgi:p90 ribosomal S6 kinase
MIPENMPEKGKDFLRRCFERDHCERWSADKLLTHSFILDELLPPVETKTGELSSSHIDGVVLSVVNFVLCSN